MAAVLLLSDLRTRVIIFRLFSLYRGHGILLSVFKAQTKVSEEQTQGPLCNLLSSCIEQNVLHITGNEQTGELTAGNGRKVNIIGNEQLKKIIIF